MRLAKKKLFLLDSIRNRRSNGLEIRNWTRYTGMISLWNCWLEGYE